MSFRKNHLFNSFISFSVFLLLLLQSVLTDTPVISAYFDSFTLIIYLFIYLFAKNVPKSLFVPNCHLNLQKDIIHNFFYITERKTHPSERGWVVHLLLKSLLLLFYFVIRCVNSSMVNLKTKNVFINCFLYLYR